MVTMAVSLPMVVGQVLQPLLGLDKLLGFKM